MSIIDRIRGHKREGVAKRKQEEARQREEQKRYEVEAKERKRQEKERRRKLENLFNQLDSMVSKMIKQVGNELWGRKFFGFKSNFNFTKNKEKLCWIAKTDQMESDHTETIYYSEGSCTQISKTRYDWSDPNHRVKYHKVMVQDSIEVKLISYDEFEVIFGYGIGQSYEFDYGEVTSSIIYGTEGSVKCPIGKQDLENALFTLIKDDSPEKRSFSFRSRRGSNR